MQRNTTLTLPDILVRKAQAYAAAHGTTVTAIVRSHLEAMTAGKTSSPQDDPLLAYSEGRLSRREAIALLGARDYAELLVRLGEADLPMPRATLDVENEALLFEKLWKQL